MTRYHQVIRYAIGYSDGNRVIVRSIDKWYVYTISEICGNTPYPNNYYRDRDKTPQWTIKSAKLSIPTLADISDWQGFCRAYIEIHGVLDATRGGKGLRLRIYGDEDVLTAIMQHLPAAPKKLQYITNKIDGKYIGSTCAIYYQSSLEVLTIMSWLDGEPKNESIHGKWYDVINKKHSE